MKQKVVFILVCFVELSIMTFAYDPNFVAEPGHFFSLAFIDGTNPDPNVLTLINNDSTPITWSVNTSGQPGWLTVTPSSGLLNPGQEAAILLSYDIAGLSVGVYEYAFEIANLSGTSGPLTIEVNLEIIGAVLHLSDHYFYQLVYMNDPSPDPNVVAISNTGVGSLNWSVGGSNLPSWLSIEPLSGNLLGGESQDITLFYDITNVGGGLYSYAFEVSDPMAKNSPQAVTVDLEVIGSIFEISKTNFEFIVEEGATTEDQVMTLLNSGGGTVNWQAELTDMPGWLSVDPTAGSLGYDESQNVTLSINSSGLADGQYEYTFEVYDPVLPSSIYEILVRLLVNEPEWNILVPDDYPTIQEAIDASQYGDKIHVAAGIYVENLTLKNGVKLVGEDEQTCIIDGNQSGISVVVAGNCDSNTEFSNFTVTNGNASLGGGMIIVHSEIQISNCIFTANTAQYGGGGMRCGGSNLTIQNCIFNGNTTQGSGGGLLCYGGNCCPKVINCSFSNNTASGGGAGICTEQDISLVLTGCNFVANNANFGGGVYSESGSLMMTNCTFNGNSSYYFGGGLYSKDNLSQVTKCRFSGNSSYCSGGGLYSTNDQSCLINCVFTGNSAGDYGGGIFNGNDSVEIINCSLYGNTSQYGGAISNFSEPKIVNCILCNNTASVGGNEIFNDSSSVPVIRYSDIAGCGGSGSAWDTSLGTDDGGNIDVDPIFVDADGVDDIVGTDDDNLRLQFPSPCIDAGDNTAPVLVETDLDGDDRFIDDRETEDTGNGSAPIIDMGAYETESYVTIWVNQEYSSSGYNDGHIWGVNAFKVIQGGIDAAVYGDTVQVAPGIYVENITLKNGVSLIGSGSNQTIINGARSGSVVTAEYCDPNTLLEGFQLTGGYVDGFGGGGILSYYSDLTVADCAFIANQGFAGGGMTIVYGQPYLSDCTFSMNVTDEDTYWGGGGLYNAYGSPVVENCIFDGNVSHGSGGGISNKSSMIIRNCLFTNNIGGGYSDALTAGGNITIINSFFLKNQTLGKGGGIYIGRSSDEISIVDCEFIQNIALRSPYGNGKGGGAYVAARYGSIENCSFYENIADGKGGGLYHSNEGIGVPNFRVAECKFIGNSAIDGYGGGIYGYYCGARFENCTFNGNSAKYYGGAASFSEGIPVIKNCILWGNTAFTYPEIFNWYGWSDLFISYSNIAGSGGSGSGWDTSLGTDGGGNIDTDPLFVDPNNGDYHLQSQAGRWDPETDSWVMDDVTSPCIDAGDPYDSFGSELFPNGGIINMGAYGGTSEASKSYFSVPVCSEPYAGDINGDCMVDLLDFAFVAEHWLEDHLTE